MNDAAIATMAIGERYLSNWKKYCAPSWQAYAAKHNFDIVCVNEPLDTSELGRSRSPSWQKCLILNQPWAAKYKQIVLLDSDVVINASSSPKITADVPVEKVGGVICASHLPDDLKVILLNYFHGPIHSYQRGLGHWQREQNRYYEHYGLTPQPEGIIQGGVLVTSPAHHRELMLQVYNTPYEVETRTYEQVPLSYEILRRQIFEPLDTRFNSVFFETMLIHYPYLFDKATANFETLARVATRVQLLNNFFLHFAYDADYVRFLFE